MNESIIIFIVLASLLKENRRKNRIYTLLKKFFIFTVLSFFINITTQHLYAQVNDSVFMTNENPQVGTDSLFILNDSTGIQQDSLSFLSDTNIVPTKKKEEVLEDKVNYNATDSIVTSIQDRKVFLYKGANITYTNIELTADYIEFDMSTNEVYAKGVPDSSGIMQGNPVFTQGKETFESEELRYNFDSKKGMITGIITEEGEGYLHSEKTKRQTNGQIHVHHGKYTTCDAKNPHFYIALNKAIVIPDDKIVSGGAYLVVADVPLKMAGLPFGWFPNTPDASAGLLVPSYDYDDKRGFCLNDLGWYFPINDYLQLKVFADIYSRGSWGARINNQYEWRYHFGGNIDASYYANRLGDPEIPSTLLNERNDFKISWSHSQKSKANPNQRFSANVNLKSSTYNQNQEISHQNNIQNIQNSSISYTRNRSGSLFNLTAKMTHSQNNQTGKINATLPEVSFNMRTINPFKSKTNSKNRWYERITLGYRSNFVSKVSASDTVFYTPGVLDEFRYGYKHSIPMSVNFQLFNLINISPNVSYQGVWSPDVINKKAFTSYNGENGVYSTDIETDTIRQFTYAHSLSPSLSLSFSKKVTGMYRNKRLDGKLVAIRHLITPSASFSIIPDMSAVMPTYNKELTYQTTDTTYRTMNYTILDHALYRAPQGSNGKSGSIRFGLKNNLEMKLREATDSTENTRKVSLLRNFDFSSSYNIYADSNNFAPVNFSTSTSIFKNIVSVRGGALFNFYAMNEAGKLTKEFQYNVDGRLLRFVSANASASFNLSPNDFNGIGKTEEEKIQQEYNYLAYLYPDLYLAGSYVNFDIPWSFNASYSWRYTKTQSLKNGPGRSLNQLLSFGGNFSLTALWKFTVNSGYDLDAKEFTQTNLSIHRDLHCWDMSFTAVPFGRYKRYNFTIRANASMLKDLKYEKKSTRNIY